MLFKLIINIITHGIKKSSYRLRALILREIFKSSNVRNDCILINCEVTVAFFCAENYLSNTHLLKKYLDVAAVVLPREKILPLIQVELGLLQRKEFRIEREITIQGT